MAAYLPKISTTYNNHGATKNFQCPDKPLHCKAFRASFTLSAAGYIAPGDAEGGGNLPLGQRYGAPQAVAEADNFRLPGGKALPHQLVEPQGVVPVMEVLQHGVVYADDIHQLEGVSVLVRVNGVGKGDLPLEFFLSAEVHEDFILNAPGGVSSQAGALGRVKAGNPLDEADGADGDQVFLIGTLGVIFFGRMKQREGFARSNAASHGPPNFRWISR